MSRVRARFTIFVVMLLSLAVHAVVSSSLAPYEQAKDDAVSVFVSVDASPLTGTGTKQRPFASIEEALSSDLVVSAQDKFKIFLLEGVYDGPGNVNITLYDIRDVSIVAWTSRVDINCKGGYFIHMEGFETQGSLWFQANGATVHNCALGAVASSKSLTVIRGVFASNASPSGGGAISVESLDYGQRVAVSIVNCIFKLNYQSLPKPDTLLTESGGGAVYVSGAVDVSIVDTQFLYNEGFQGGAVYLQNNANVQFLGLCGFQGNYAGHPLLAPQQLALRAFWAANGGPTADLPASLPSFRESLGGGAVMSRTLSSPGSVKSVDLGFDGTTFSHNVAETHGGALFVGGSEALSLSLESCVMRNNTAGFRGAGLFLSGSVSGRWADTFIWDNWLHALKPLTDAPTKAPTRAPSNPTRVTMASRDASQPRVVAPPLSNVYCDLSSTWSRQRPKLMWNEECDLCVWKNHTMTQYNEDAMDVCSRSKFHFNTTEIILFSTIGGIGLMAGLAFTWTYCRSQPRKRRGPVPKLLDDSIAMDEFSSSGTGVRRLLRAPTYAMLDEEDQPLPSHDFMRTSLSAGRLTYKEIDFGELVVDPDPIGTGAFGMVFRARWRGSVVAVKKLIGMIDEAHVEDFCAEAQMMHTVGNHPNVIKLFGACTQAPNYCLVTPYYPNGSVKDFLRRQERVTWTMLIKIATQTSAGMRHLHKENVIHRDLAARNILIDENHDVHITDFGLARIISNARYAKTHSNVGAVAWMAPESITARKYSFKSDVWSFGVCVWELCTGSVPFSGMEPIHVAISVSEGERLAIPPYVPDVLAKIMIECWAEKPEDRPTMFDLYETLRRLGADLESGQLVFEYGVVPSHRRGWDVSAGEASESSDALDLSGWRSSELSHDDDVSGVEAGGSGGRIVSSGEAKLLGSARGRTVASRWLREGGVGGAGRVPVAEPRDSVRNWVPRYNGARVAYHARYQGPVVSRTQGSDGDADVDVDVDAEADDGEDDVSDDNVDDDNYDGHGVGGMDGDGAMVPLLLRSSFHRNDGGPRAEGGRFVAHLGSDVDDEDVSRDSAGDRGGGGSDVMGSNDTDHEDLASACADALPAVAQQRRRARSH